MLKRRPPFGLAFGRRQGCEVRLRAQSRRQPLAVEFIVTRMSASVTLAAASALMARPPDEGSARPVKVGVPMTLISEQQPFPDRDEDQHGGRGGGQHQRRGDHRSRRHQRHQPSPTRWDSGMLGADSRLNSALPTDRAPDRRELPGRWQDRLRVAVRMVQHQFVGDRGDDDARHDQDMEIGIAAARERAGIARTSRSVAGALGADIEVDRPHRDAAGERDQNAATVAAVHVESAKVAPVTRINSPSAMMTNRPQRSAICAAFDVPVLGARAAQPRHPEAGGGSKQSNADCQAQMASRPPDRRRSSRRSRTAPPRLPDRDAEEVAIVAGVVALEAHSMNWLR